jgi:uncharacterized phage protein gp47/JayE
MAIEFKSPDTIAEEYLTTLKALKPEINRDQQDSDWWVRSRVVGGVISGAYSDQLKIANDAFPQSARREAVERHLLTYTGSGFRSATQASGPVKITGASGTLVPAGTQFVYSPNGNTYQSLASLTLGGAGSGIVTVKSVLTGQSQNLTQGASLTLPSPPPNVNATAIVFGGDIADGRDIESTEDGAARVLSVIRNPTAGGTESDYQQYALEADGAVTSASVLRWIYGLGTVGVIITSGTTDIDAAIDNNVPIVRQPSQALINKVKDYVDAKNPVTDCLHVFGAQEVSQDVTIRVKYLDTYNGSTVLTGQTLTLNQLVEREVKRALYKVPTGGRKIGASGYIVASEIEEAVDSKLSALPYAQGLIAEVIVDRQVDQLTSSGYNRLLRAQEIVVPGTITVVEL